MRYNTVRNIICIHIYKKTVIKIFSVLAIYLCCVSSIHFCNLFINDKR